MTSRLSSMLVQDGRVTAKKMADDFFGKFSTIVGDRFAAEQPAAPAPAPTLPPPTWVPVTGLPVFIDCPVWVESGANEWAEDLARGLRAVGLDARLLFTEENTELVRIPGPRPALPSDVPVERLTPLGDDCWGARWGTLTHLLESHAPCVYLPHYDVRHSGVSTLLPQDVMVVGTVHGARGVDLEHVTRLGFAWNAVVATNTQAADELRAALPALARELEVTLERIVPVGFDRERHLSCSYREAPGLVYLSLHPDPLTLAEAIVHETQHGKLNLLSWLDPILANDPAERVPSPARPDLRPLYGVLLAAHAFIPVAALHHQLAALHHPLATTPSFERRRRQVRDGNAAALATLAAHAHPTAVGAKVIAALAELHAQLS